MALIAPPTRATAKMPWHKKWVNDSGAEITGLGKHLLASPTPEPAPAATQLGVPTVGQIMPLAYEPLVAPGNSGAPEPEPEDPTLAEMILADGPVFYVRHGEAPGVTTLVDLSGENNHASISGVTLGQAGLVDDDADTAALYGAAGFANVGLGNNLQLQRFSLLALVKLTQALSDAVVIRYNCNDANVRGRGYEIRIINGVAVFYCGFGADGFHQLAGVTVIPNATRCLVGAMWDGANMRVCINGVVDGIQGFSGRTISYENALGLNLHRIVTQAAIIYDDPIVLDEVAVFPSYVPAERQAQYWAKITGA